MELTAKLGQPIPVTNAKAGEVIDLALPASPTGWLDVGIYSNPKTVDGAEVELVGGGYRKVGAARLTHLYMQGKGASSATVKVLDATGFDIVVKSMNAATAAKMASRQQKV